MFNDDDEKWLRHALKLAKFAAEQGEVPVGAVLVRENEILAEGHNQPIARHDPSAHAEMMVLRVAGEHLRNYRLVDTTLYVTLEPCCMCAGALVHARIGRLVYGANDPRAGAVVSKLQLLDANFLNHRVAHAGGLLAPECGEILSQFFQKRRSA